MAAPLEFLHVIDRHPEVGSGKTTAARSASARRKPC
jgi:hypothetical protein